MRKITSNFLLLRAMAIVLLLAFVVFYFVKSSVLVLFYENGVTQSISWLNPLNGITHQTIYYENGQIKRKWYLKNNKKIGMRRDYYDTGVLWEESNYDSAGRLTGEFKEYNKDGSLRSIKYCLEDKFQGIGYFFYPDGRLKAINRFKNDTLYFVRTYAYDTEGKVKDSLEVLVPSIQVRSNLKYNDTVSFSFSIITDKLDYLQDSVYVYYDLGWEKENGKFPFPEFSRNFSNNRISKRLILSTEIVPQFLYGWLEYHEPGGKIVPFQEFVDTIR